MTDVWKSAPVMWVTDEAIVDYALGSAEDQAAAAARLDAGAAVSLARWRALPRRVRVARLLHARLAPYRGRVSMAVDVLRGLHECGDD